MSHFAVVTAMTNHSIVAVSLRAILAAEQDHHDWMRSSSRIEWLQREDER